MSSTPYFGIAITIAAYEAGKWLNKKLKHPIFNPLLLAAAIIIVVLKISGIPLSNYQVGGQFITFFVPPVTVALMVPLYDNRKMLYENFVPIMVGILAGAVFSITINGIMARLMGFDSILAISSIPQSATNAISAGLAKEYGGHEAITAVIVVIRGTAGVILAKAVLKAFHIADPIAQGISLGTASHAFGAAEAFELGKLQGAMAGLSIALTGIITVIFMPIGVWVYQMLL